MQKYLLIVYSFMLGLAACTGPAATPGAPTPLTTQTVPPVSEVTEISEATKISEATPSRTPIPQPTATSAPTATSTTIPTLQDIGAIAAGWDHTCVLTTAGRVKCWGNNKYGQLGDGTTLQRTTPVDVSGLKSRAAAVVAGNGYTCALTISGGVQCWGWNYYGQLGDGTNTHRSLPGDVMGLASEVTAIASGGDHTCALTTSGGVKCWGYNRRGQLGDGTLGTPPTYGKPLPVSVKGLASGAVSLAASGTHTCALVAAGGVKCWGLNYYGQLGDSAGIGTLTGIPAPVDVRGLTNGVKAIAAGEQHTCGLTTNGRMMCWGGNVHGQLGNDIGLATQDSYPLPIEVEGLAGEVTALAAGGDHTCARIAGGGVKCWGGNYYGQLGDGTVTGAISGNPAPVDVKGLAGEVTALSAGGDHTCALITNGRVNCWGWNAYGQLGDGTTRDSSWPLDVRAGQPAEAPPATPHPCGSVLGESSVASSEAEGIIARQANEVVWALKNKDVQKLAAFVHPTQGVLFSPYAFVRKDENQVFTSTEVRNGLTNNTRYLWGYTDGKGDPIELTFAEYLDAFTYGWDFVNADAVGYNETLGCGNTLNNIYEAYPQAIVVEYYFPGFHPRYTGFDWASLRLVFQANGDAWYLVAVINDQWTL